MKKRLLLALLILSPLLGRTQSIEGEWVGTLQLNVSLRIVFHITKTDTGYSTSLDSPDQGAKGIPTKSTAFHSPKLTIDMPQLHASFEGVLQNDSVIVGKFTQGGVTFDLDLKRGSLPAAVRPQTPKPPFPYTSENVFFHNSKAGIDLAGTLTLPKDKVNPPAVILLSGSGPQNRDEELVEHKPFWVIADYLSRHGIAVLRFDDRGVGQSQGQYENAGLQDFSSDAEAAFNYMLSRKDIDRNNIGLIGHSLGASEAFIVASHDSRVAFVISLAGTGVSGDSLLLKQNEEILKQNGIMPEQWESYRRDLRRAYNVLLQNKSIAEIKSELNTLTDSIQVPGITSDSIRRQSVEALWTALTTPEIISFIRYNPCSDLSRIKCPVLAINGDKDVQVDATVNTEAIARCLKAGGNKHVTVKVFPGLNHLFQHCVTCTVSEYGKLEETFSPEVLQTMVEWINTTRKQP